MNSMLSLKNSSETWKKKQAGFTYTLRKKQKRKQKHTTKYTQMQTQKENLNIWNDIFLRHETLFMPAWTQIYLINFDSDDIS